MVQQKVPNRGPELQAVCATFVSMAFVAMMLRLFVRIRLVRAFGWDDAWMTFALLAHIMFATCAIAGVHYGTGRHFRDLTPEGIFMAMRYWWLCYIGYCLAMIGAKISIGIFLLRVTVVKMHRWIIYTVMGLTVLTGTVFFFVTLFQCHPINFFWERTIEGGSCVNIDVIIGLTFLYSAISAICDFTYGILPIFLVWNLNMSRNSKLMLIPILSMACVASTAVVVRMAFVMDFKSNDFLYDTVDIAVWSDIEQGLAITAGSLATLRPLYRIVSQKLGLSTNATGPKASNEKGSRQQWHPSSSSNNKKKRSGPFSLITMTRNDRTKSGHDSDEEYSLGNLQPIQIRDDENDDHQSHDTEKGFNTWRVQVGRDGSEENLNQKPAQKPTSGGITRQTDVYMERSRV